MNSRTNTSDHRTWFPDVAYWCIGTGTSFMERGVIMDIYIYIRWIKDQLHPIDDPEADLVRTSNDSTSGS